MGYSTKIFFTKEIERAKKVPRGKFSAEGTLTSVVLKM
jgi:hypothetical protein